MKKTKDGKGGKVLTDKEKMELIKNGTLKTRRTTKKK